MAMAFSAKLQYLLLFSLFLTPFSLCNDLNHSLTPSQEVQGLLVTHGLPRGLFPINVKFYSFNPKESTFSITFDHQCKLSFPPPFFYAKSFTGKLLGGKVSDISGIYAVFNEYDFRPVTDILVRPFGSLNIEFQGQFPTFVEPVASFEQLHDCITKSLQQSLLGSA